jgi:hypothetical protein
MKVYITQSVPVELDGAAVKQCFEKYLEDLCGGEHVYISDKGVVEEWEDTGHGSGITRKVEDPSPTQIAALKFRADLQAIKRAEYEEREKQRVKKQKGTR